MTASGLESQTMAVAHNQQVSQGNLVNAIVNLVFMVADVINVSLENGASPHPQLELASVNHHLLINNYQSIL